MGTISAKDGSTWKEVKGALVREYGKWYAPAVLHVKESGVWTEVLPKIGDGSIAITEVTAGYNTFESGTFKHVVLSNGNIAVFRATPSSDISWNVTKMIVDPSTNTLVQGWAEVFNVTKDFATEVFFDVCVSSNGKLYVAGVDTNCYIYSSDGITLTDTIQYTMIGQGTNTVSPRHITTKASGTTVIITYISPILNSYVPEESDGKAQMATINDTTLDITDFKFYTASDYMYKVQSDIVGSKIVSILIGKTKDVRLCSTNLDGTGASTGELSAGYIASDIFAPFTVTGLDDSYSVYFGGSNELSMLVSGAYLATPSEIVLPKPLRDSDNNGILFNTSDRFVLTKENYIVALNKYAGFISHEYPVKNVEDKTNTYFSKVNDSLFCFSNGLNLYKIEVT